MPARAAALVLAGTVLLLPAQPRAADGIFGDILTRPAGAEKPWLLQGSERDLRAHEARELRRARWQSERTRMGRTGAVDGQAGGLHDQVAAAH